MSEFAPPSYTGDPTMARCSEDYFKLGFWGLQIALGAHALGLTKMARFAPGTSGDTALALAEEAANARRVKNGKSRVNPFASGDKVGKAYQARALDYRRQNMM